MSEVIFGMPVEFAAAKIESVRSFRPSSVICPPPIVEG